MVIPAMFVIFSVFLRYMGIRLMSYLIDVGVFFVCLCGRNVISQNRSKM
jgi:hypothetical protein